MIATQPLKGYRLYAVSGNHAFDKAERFREYCTPKTIILLEYMPFTLMAGFLYVFAVLGVGFVAYGLSIFFYVYAHRLSGAARTSAYYAVAPFICTLLSLAIFGEFSKYTYFIALAVMVVGAWLCSRDKPLFKKKDEKGQGPRALTIPL